MLESSLVRNLIVLGAIVTVAIIAKPTYGGCPLGACCLGPFECDDNGGTGMDEKECVEFNKGTWFPCESCIGLTSGELCAGPSESIPATSDWGLLVMSLLVLTGGSLIHVRRESGIGISPR